MCSVSPKIERSLRVYEWEGVHARPEFFFLPLSSRHETDRVSQEHLQELRKKNLPIVANDIAYDREQINEANETSRRQRRLGRGT